MQGFITTQGLMEKYKVSRQAVHQWRVMGLESVKIDGRTMIYNEHDVHQWLLQNRNERRNRGAIK